MLRLTLAALWLSLAGLYLASLAHAAQSARTAVAQEWRMF